MKFETEKNKIRTGLAYPLKTSMLKNAIENSNIDCNIHLIYWTPKQHDDSYNILECEYWLPNKNVDYDRFYIRAGVVKSEDRKKVEILMKNEVIPVLIEFIQKKKSEPINSTVKSQPSYFKAVFVGNKIVINS